MALITRDDLKVELALKDSADNTLADTICAAVVSVFEALSGRTLEQAEYTEYFDIEPYQDRVFLENFPVCGTSTFSVWDDPDHIWDDSDLIPSTDYRVDYVRGIVYYDSYFFEGNQSVKVTYTAGHAISSIPAGLKQVLVRQAVVWFKQAKNGTWDVQSVTLPAGGGGSTIERHAKGLLPEFELMAQLQSG